MLRYIYTTCNIIVFNFWLHSELKPLHIYFPSLLSIVGKSKKSYLFRDEARLFRTFSTPTCPHVITDLDSKMTHIARIRALLSAVIVELPNKGSSCLYIYLGVCEIQNVYRLPGSPQARRQILLSKVIVGPSLFRDLVMVEILPFFPYFFPFFIERNEISKTI